MNPAPGVLIHHVQDAMGRHGAAGRTAIIDWRGPTSYAALARAVDCYAGGVKERIDGRGTLVGVFAARTASSVAAFIGAMQAGCCSSFIDPKMAFDTLASRMKTVGMRHLIVDDQHEESRKFFLSYNISVHSLSEVSGRAFRDEELKPNDEAMVLFTSGSTGEPKGALLSHNNLLVNAKGIIRHTGLTSDDRLLHVMPLHHTNGVNNQLMAPLLAGATVVLIEKFRAECLIDQIRTYAPTYVTGVPTMYLRVLPHISTKESLRSLRFLRCGSAPIDIRLHEQIEESFGVPLSISYGLSEATCTSTMNPPSARRIGTVGTVLCGQEVKLFSPGTNKDVTASAEGEVCITGPTIMKGYIPAVKEFPIVDGWLRTGDLGRFDGEGYLTITGRIKDVIKRGGEGLSPQQIETVLNSHPEVSISCVVADADRELGEVPIAFVVPRVAGEVSEEGLKKWVDERLSRAYVPRAIRFVKTLPENSAGKVDRSALRALLARGLSEAPRQLS
jgi:acyl-CoA synthetase (AMP-forming)/AMP-acid ligase II